MCQGSCWRPKTASISGENSMGPLNNVTLERENITTTLVNSVLVDLNSVAALAGQWT